MPRSARRILAALALATLPAPALPAELSVYPIRLEVTDKQPVTSMTVRNSGADPALLHLRVMSWAQPSGVDAYEHTRDVLANPAVIRLAPGAEQIIRFGYQGAAGAKEAAYRVFLQEVPIASDAAAPGAIQTLLQVSVPMFIRGQDASVTMAWRLGLENGRPLLEARNTGGTHVQVTGLVLKRGGAEAPRQALSLYVLPGAVRWQPVDIPGLRTGEQVTVTATTDQGEMQAAVTVEASLAVGGP